MPTKAPAKITTIEDAEKAIRKAYRKLTKDTTDAGGIRIRILRESVAVDPRLMDKALTAMAGQKGVHLRAEADQRTLHILDRQPRMGGLDLGGTMRHDLYIERR